MKKVLQMSVAIAKIINLVAIAALVVMVGVTIIDVFMRLFFSAPITGSVEIVRMMMVCMAPSFIAALFFNRHVSVGLFIDRLGRKGQLAFDTFGYSLSAALCGLMCYQGFIDMNTKIQRNQTYTILKMPTWPFYLVFAIAMGLLAIAIVIKLISKYADKDAYSPKESLVEASEKEGQLHE